MGSVRRSNLAVVVAWLACAACSQQAEPTFFDTSHCRIYEQPTIRGGDAYSYCVVQPTLGYHEILLTNDASQGSFGYGAETTALYVSVPDSSPGRSHVVLGDPTKARSEVTMAYLGAGLSGSGELETNVADYSSGDFELSLSFHAVQLGGNAITGTVKIRASDQLSALETEGASK